MWEEVSQVQNLGGQCYRSLYEMKCLGDSIMAGERERKTVVLLVSLQSSVESFSSHTGTTTIVVRKLESRRTIYVFTNTVPAKQQAITRPCTFRAQVIIFIEEDFLKYKKSRQMIIFRKHSTRNVNVKDTAGQNRNQRT